MDVAYISGWSALAGVLKTYAGYYNDVRTHLALSKDAPFGRPVQAIGQIVPEPILGGLHHQYVRMA
jgi:hypothetical protein